MLNKIKSDFIINESILRNELEIYSCNVALHYTYIVIDKLFNPNVLGGIFRLDPDSYNFSGDLHELNAERNTLRKMRPGKGYW